MSNVPLPTLEQVKNHLRVDMEDAFEDALIGDLITAARGHIGEYLENDLAERVPEPVAAAVLLLVADLYENRERQQLDALRLNPTYVMLLKPYRDMSVL